MFDKRKRAERSTGDSTRMSVTLPASTKEAIEQYAHKYGVTESYAAQHFLKIGLTAESIALDGGEVIANGRDGKPITLANPKGNFLFRETRLATRR